MLDIRKIREDYEGIRKSVESRGQGSYNIERIPELDEKRRSILSTVEQMKNKQNVDSKAIPTMKKEGKDTTALMAEMKQLSEEIKKLDGELAVIEEDIRNTLLFIPNTPNPAVPVGKDDSENVEVRKWGEPRDFDFEKKAHWDVGQDLDILDF